VIFAWGGVDHSADVRSAEHALLIEKDQNYSSIDLPRYNTNGQLCSNRDYFFPVTTECARGACNMPETMFMGSKHGEICYSRAYGLVAPPSGDESNQCDWTPDSQGYSTILFNQASYSYAWKDAEGTIFTPAWASVWIPCALQNGYNLDCTDFNACLEGHTCSDDGDEGATCQDDAPPGKSYSCICTEGFYPEGFQCLEVAANNFVEYPGGTSSAVFFGDTVLNPNNYFSLSTLETNSYGSLHWEFVLGEYWEMSFDFYAGDGTGADESWLFVYEDIDPTTWVYAGPTFRNSGTASTGYHYAPMEYNSAVGCTTGPGYKIIAPGHQCIAMSSSTTIGDGNWKRLSIIFERNADLTSDRSRMYLDAPAEGAENLELLDISHTHGSDVVNYDDPVYVGFASRTGASTNYHLIRDFQMVFECPAGWVTRNGACYRS
jgi:hypothetical protein